MVPPQNLWRLIEASWGGEAIDFDAIDPVLVGFSPGGALTLHMGNCVSGTYSILSYGEGEYELMSEGFSPNPCVESHEKLFARVATAVGITTEYRMHNGQLRLTGDGIQLVLAPEDPINSVPFPGGLPDPVPHNIPFGLWQLTSVEYQGENVAFDSLAPVAFRVSEERLAVLYSEESGCRSFDVRVLSYDGQVYRLVSDGASPADQCGDPMDAEMLSLVIALFNTNIHELKGEQLFLIGPKSRLTLHR